MAYSLDHNSVTTTNGSGASAIVNTTFTDTEGNNALSINYPAAGISDVTFQLYDLAGKVYWIENDIISNSVLSENYFKEFFYDAMLRPATKIDRDNVETDYSPDAMGNVTNRSILGAGLQWQATFNNAGKILQEKYVNGSTATRTNTYTYYSSGSPFAGLLQTKTDGRGVSCTYLYDDWFHTTNMTCTGSLPEQNLTTTWQYEPRGFATNITEQFASTNTGPATSVQHSFDSYGEMASESVSAGAFSYGAGQNFDLAGRRTTLGIGSAFYSFGWQADGNLILANDGSGSGSYSFDTAGLLTSRLVGGRSTSIASRDGEGRPLTIATAVNTLSQMTESLAWAGEGLVATHTLARADFTDSRSYAYASLSRRLIQEQLNLNGSTRWTNAMVYDNGVASELGTLTQMGKAAGASNEWSGVADSFSRVTTETNNTYQYTAYGHVNGQSTLTAWLDNQPISVSGVGTNAIQWRAAMELVPGAHQLKVAAAHPSGFYTAWATNSFTNNIAYQTAADTFDNAGNITQRIWKNPNGTTNRTQTLLWDARGRLHAVTERDSNNSGYNWTAVYDALSRRLQTTTILVTNGAASTAPPQNIRSFYDPQVEFLELGVQYGSQPIWKLYGPDSNGKYGGLNGTGGFDGVSPGLNQFYPTISDARGNILAEITNGVVAWNPSRPTGYGAVPDYRPVALANGADIAQASAWRGRWPDITGYYQIGLRPYNPISGGWLTYDSAWNDRDPNCYTFAGGDPINYFDSDGRVTKALYYVGGSSAQDFRLLGMGLNSYADQSSSYVLGTTAAFLGQIFNTDAAIMTPSTYGNQAISDYNAQGGGFLGALGAANRYNPTLPFFNLFSGIDAIQGNTLSGMQLTQNGLTAFGSTLLVGSSFITAPTLSLADSPVLSTATQLEFPFAQNVTTPMTTVIGSGQDVIAFMASRGFQTPLDAQAAGYNVFNFGNIPAAELDSQNALWLNNALQRNDAVLQLTDQSSWESQLNNIFRDDPQGRPSSGFLDVEMPIINNYSGVNVIPQHATSPGIH